MRLLPGRSESDTWTLVGGLGSVVIAAAGVSVGALPVDDPFGAVPAVALARAHRTTSLILAYVGLTLLLIAWLRLGDVIRRNGVHQRGLWVALACWSAPLMLTAPLYSRDVYSYLAQAMMFGSHLDPYRLGPAALGGPLAADVSPPWRNTTAPYGPAFLAVAAGVVRLSGANPVLGVLLLRLVGAAAVLVVAGCVAALAARYGVDPRRATWLGVLNPLVLQHLIAGVHNDALMLALLLLGVLAGLRGRLVLAGVLIGLAAMIKVPALIALPFLIPAAAAARRSGAPSGRRLPGRQLAGRRLPGRRLPGWADHLMVAATLGLAAAGTMVALTSALGSWYGWIGALGGTVKLHNGLSLVTDLGDLLAALPGLRGAVPPFDPVSVLRLAGLAGVGLVMLRLLRTQRDRPVLAIGLSFAALLLLGPAGHPWYLLWAALPLAAGTLDARVVRAVAGLSLVLAYYPAPTGETPTRDTLYAAVAAAFTGVVLLPRWMNRRRPAALPVPVPVAVPAAAAATAAGPISSTTPGRPAAHTPIDRR